MSYTAPYIDSTGLHLPSYQDILGDLIQQAQGIFGADIYLQPDSQDYQYISIIAAKINDTLQAIQLAYDSRSPSTAIGAALDGLIKINGITRNTYTYSTCVVTLTGTAGAVISNGVVQDVSGKYWNLTPSVTIGTGGTVDVTATCQTSGPISAGPGDISIIATPTYGWTSVTNSLAATVGVAPEVDSAVRSRQTYSTAQPSRSILEGTKGAIANITGVTRSEVYENKTSTTDSNGLPAHSITAVVEGGANADIAQAIFLKKGPGCGTNGTTSVNVTDQFGQVIAIGFYRPSYVDFDVVVNVKKWNGYTTQTTTDIQTAVVNYLNNLSIGENIPYSSLWGSALTAMPDLTRPLFSITSLTACVHSGTPGTVDITMLFNQLARGNAAYVTVNAT